MHRLHMLLVALLLAAFGAVGRCEDPVGGNAGQYDRQLLAELQAASTTVLLRQSRLKDLAPQYWVEADPTLSWEQALAVADTKFAGDPLKRTLFLAQYLKQDDPMARITEMHMPYSGGIAITQGSGTVECYELHEKPEAPANTSTLSEQVAGIHRFMYQSRIALQIAHSDTKILGPCMLLLRDLTVKTLPYATLDFAMDGTLRGFTRAIPLPNSPITFEVGGNTSGVGGTDYYYAFVKMNGKFLEHIDYSPDKIITERSVYSPDASGRTLYREMYTDGKLTKRVWYKEENTERGTQTVKDRTETF